MESRRKSDADTADPRLTRRAVLVRLGTLSLLPAVSPRLFSPAVFGGVPDDDMILADTFEKLGRFADIGSAIGAAARLFLGAPYVGHTLEVPGEEQLVVNLRGFDCVSLVEASLVIGRCVRLGERSMEVYRRELTRIRYRQGKIAGYPSRLHYFTDWIADNGEKGVLQDLTSAIGGVPHGGRREYMTQNRSAYRQLSDPEVFESIRAQETRLSARTWLSVPRPAVAQAQEHLQEGDVVGIVSSLRSLDIAHTGLVIEEGGEKRFLHAPLSGGSVEIAEGTLAEYVAAEPKRAGIVAARPLEPEAGIKHRGDHQNRKGKP